MSPLAIRVPVFDPSRFLRSMELPAYLLFHPFVVAIGLLVSLFCSIFVLNAFLADPEQFIREASQIPLGFWFVILFVYVGVKVLHELGHALACVRWKANCREIGLLFLFFTPCMYCDTTDSWKLQSKWHRAAIAAAGLYVELFIASFAALIWLNTNDGVERMIAASVMLMCSMGTILINGNPCFKYDGYYILSDVWGVPNLSQQSAAALWQILIAALGGRKIEPTDFDKNIWLLALYSLVSAVYRLVILVLLLWFVWGLLVPKGLGFFAILIVATTLFGVVRMVTRFFDGIFTEFFAPKPIRFGRALFLLTAVAILIFFVFKIPVPNYVRARGVLDFHDKQSLFAPQNSTIIAAAEPNSYLQKGDLVFEFDCPEKRLESIVLANEISQLNRRIELLKQSSVNEPSAAFEIPTLVELLNELLSKQGVLQPELESLRMTAPVNGFFIPSDRKGAIPLTFPNDLRLVKHVAHESNLGSAVERGVLLGWFTAKQKISFQTLVSESDIKSLGIGMQAECMLDSHTSRIVRGRISRISPDPIEEITPEFLGDHWLVTERNEKGKLQPVTPHYQVTVEAESVVPSSIKGANATIQFKIASMTLADHILRYIRTKFKPIY